MNSQEVFKRQAADERRLAPLYIMLRDRLAQHEYDTVYRMHAWDLSGRLIPVYMRRTLDLLPLGSKTLFRLLLIGDTLSRNDLRCVFSSDETDELVAADVLAEVDRGIKSNIVVELNRELWIFTDTYVDPVTSVYYSEDSQFLASQIVSRPGDSCLDLCTGTGVQAMMCLRGGGEGVDAVDVNSRAVRTARLNAMINGLTDRMSVYEGSLFEPLPADKTYDLIVCNPPLLPIPEDVDYPLVGHGGADGLRLVRPIVSALATRLSPGGRALIIGACLGTEKRPHLLDDLTPLAENGFDVSLFLPLRMDRSEWFRNVFDTSRQLYPGSNSLQVSVRMQKAFAAHNASHVFTYVIKAQRLKGKATGQIRTFDFTHTGKGSYWFVKPQRL